MKNRKKPLSMSEYEYLYGFRLLRTQ